MSCVDLRGDERHSEQQRCGGAAGPAAARAPAAAAAPAPARAADAAAAKGGGHRAGQVEGAPWCMVPW